jgi:pimeloyl-ACP methyl ester carboxylesterase
LDNGFDVFSFEPRGQGESDPQPGYGPMQWVTQYEVRDTEAAISYLKNRPDAEHRGIGFFGFSKGACAGLLAASRHEYIRCFVTDGVFATLTTMIPYMQKWIAIFSTRKWIQRNLPWIYYWLIAGAALRALRRCHGWRFPHLERVLPLLAPRPLFMIQGGADNYIKPEMARQLFERAKQPKDLWIVDGAKHNQSLNVAGDEYKERVLNFFLEHLAGDRHESFDQGAAHRELGGARAISGTARAKSSREPIAPRR